MLSKLILELHIILDSLSFLDRQTTRDLVKYYNERHDKFATCTFLAALTSDIWSGCTREGYLSVVAHYVNDDWVIEKRIICFKLIDVAHTVENIVDCIIKVVEALVLQTKYSQLL